MHVETGLTALLPQEGARDAATRAEVAARVRQAVEQARQAQLDARQAAQQAQLEARTAAQEARVAAQEAQGTPGLPVPPPPERVVVQDGRIVVTNADGRTSTIEVPGGMGRGDVRGGPGDIPPNVVSVITMFFVTVAVIAIGTPLARAIGRWLDRRGTSSPLPPADVTASLERIEQAVDTVAVEVERISEGQRFTSRLMAELRQVPQLEGTRIPEPRR